MILKWKRDDHGVYTARSLKDDTWYYTIFHDSEGWIPEVYQRRRGVNVDSTTLCTIPCSRLTYAKHLCEKYEEELT